MHPDSYWVINHQNNRRLRRNTHDIKPRHPISDSQHGARTVPSLDSPKGNAQPDPVQSRYVYPPETRPASVPDAPSRAASPGLADAGVREAPPCEETPIAESSPPVDEQGLHPQPSTTSQSTPQRTRSSRVSRSTKDPNFIY